MFVSDRTGWSDKNIFVISLIEDRRAIPIYMLSLAKQGCSNLREQKALINPVLPLFKEYRILVLDDREFQAREIGELVT